MHVSDKTVWVGPRLALVECANKPYPTKQAEEDAEVVAGVHSKYVAITWGRNPELLAHGDNYHEVIAAGLKYGVVLTYNGDMVEDEKDIQYLDQSVEPPCKAYSPEELKAIRIVSELVRNSEVPLADTVSILFDMGNLLELQYDWCAPCNTDTPHVDGNCLLCGQRKTAYYPR